MTIGLYAHGSTVTALDTIARIETKCLNAGDQPKVATRLLEPAPGRGTVASTMVQNGDSGRVGQPSGRAAGLPPCRRCRHESRERDLTVFNVGGNKYRLIARIRYDYQLVNVRAVLTHKAYSEGKWKD